MLGFHGSAYVLELILSVLVPALSDRKPWLVVDQLKKQARDLPVEVIVLEDGRQCSIGKKRNELIRSAIGDYVSFVDDDDEVADDYVARILKALEKDPDAVGICLAYHHDGVWKKNIFCSHGSPYMDLPTYGMRPIWPVCPVRRSIALQIPYPDLSRAEDGVWATLLQESCLVKRTFDLHDKPLYLYQYDSTRSSMNNESRSRVRDPKDFSNDCSRVGSIVAIRSLPSIEDVVRAAGWDPATWDGTYVIDANGHDLVETAVRGCLAELQLRLPTARIDLHVSEKSEPVVAHGPGGYRIRGNDIFVSAHRWRPELWNELLSGTSTREGITDLVAYSIGVKRR